MAAPTGTGNNNPNFHPTELLFDPRRGMSYRQRVTCGILTNTAENQLLELLAQVQALGGSGRMIFSAKLPELAWEFPGIPSNLSGVLEEMFFDDWQMQLDDLTNTIFANPLIYANVNYNDRCVLQEYAKLGSGTPLPTVVTNLNAAIAAGTIAAPNTGDGGTSGGLFQAPTSSLAKQLFLMIDKDQTEFLQPLPVLHHTTVCSPGATYNSVRSNEMCIYTTAQLLSEVGEGWTYNLPGRMYSQIAAFPTMSAPSNEASYYTWGWLKTRATQGTQTNFMIEAHQEYKLNLWPNIFYALHP